MSTFVIFKIFIFLEVPIKSLIFNVFTIQPKLSNQPTKEAVGVSEDKKALCT